MYGLIYKWKLPDSAQESELINDFENIVALAAKHGAISTNLYHTNIDGEFIGIEFWPSKEVYANWFNQDTFSFQTSQDQKYLDLLDKIKNVYKNQLVSEVTEVM